MPIKYKKFSNGMKLVYQKNNKKITLMDIFIKVGSVNEPKELAGVAHFIEHMVFKGTKRLKNSEIISQVFDSIGAYINAHTLLEYTYYSVKCDSDYAKLCLDTLLDMILHSIFDKKEIAKEKHVVIEEITTIKDNPSNLIGELSYESLFTGSNLSNSIGGTPEVILKYNYTKILEFYKHFYRAENLVISVCSNLSFTKICGLIQKQNIKNRAIKKLTAFVPQMTITLPKEQIILHQKKLEKTYIAVGFRVCGTNHPDYYALDLLKIILTGNMSSLLFVELREKNGLTYSVYIDFDTHTTIGNFIIVTNVDKDKIFNNYKKQGALDVIMETLTNLKKTGVNDEQINIAKGYLKGALTLSQENTTNISEINGIRYLFNQEDKNIPIEDIFEKKYKKVTKNKINYVIKKYLTKTNMSTAYIGNNIKDLKKKLLKSEKKL